MIVWGTKQLPSRLLLTKMQINIFIERENKNSKIGLNENSSLKDLFNELKINPVTVIAARNDELITENEKLKDNDNIMIIPVVSGG